MSLLTEVVKNLFSRPFTLKYPKEKPFLPDGYRGRHEYNKEKCIYCGNCARNCPVGCIVVNRENKTWSVDLSRCIFCGVCQEVCPTKCLVLGKKYELATTDRKLARLDY